MSYAILFSLLFGSAMGFFADQCAKMPLKQCVGGDLSSALVDTAADCCNLCSSTDGCKGYTFDAYDDSGKPNPTCFMKSSCDSQDTCRSCTAGTVADIPKTETLPTPSSNVFCPSAGDLTIAYADASPPQLNDGGWVINGGGGVATKSSFNLLGGYVEYDIDLSSVPVGINANIYTISPSNIGGSFTSGSYCDGADNDKPWCVEVDWIESNGNCGGATTLHTVPGPGPNGCTSWGCRGDYHYNGKTSFHMRVEFGTDGTWKTIRDGQEIGLNPSPGGSDWSKLAEQYSQYGAVLYSSQWAGWTPVDDCGGGGDLGGARFVISNLKISGSVVQGPTPRSC